MKMEDLYKRIICSDNLHENEWPSCLPCGNSYCSGCIEKATKYKRGSCGNCQNELQGSMSDIQSNHSMETLLLSVKQTQSGPLKRKYHDPVDEQNEKLRKIVQVNEEMHSHPSIYEAFLAERKTIHQEIINKITDIAKQNQNMINVLNKEQITVSNYLKEGQEDKKLAIEKLDMYNSTSDTKDSKIYYDDLGKCHAKLEAWQIACSKQLSNVDTAVRSEKMISDTNAAFKEISISKTLGDPSSSLAIMNMLMTIKGEAPFLNMLSVLDLSEPLKDLAYKEEIYAVQNNLGYIRSALITVMDGKPLLHYLQNNTPPVNAKCIQHSELICLLNNNSLVAFMDLAWEGSIRGRLYIDLSPDSPLARHFRILCTGDFGSTYANSRILEVCRKGHEKNERIKAGDYERNDGSGGALVIETLNVKDGNYRRKSGPGIVWASYTLNDPTRIAQFSITTGICNGMPYSKVFGQVCDGLDLVKEAINEVEDIRCVVIADCGVVLPI